MKNTLAIVLLTVCCVCVAFTGGLFVGRNTGRTTVQLSQLPTKPAVTAPSGETDSPAAPVNINTATAAQLQTLPGIGEATALRIIDYRTEHGPYQFPTDLLRVEGIGEKKLAAIIDYITIQEDLS
jgi:competence ComEA-like helix-hairpin-helix protein